ncbi:hypothetical protein BKA82DRAFT_1002182 [Pisolithus tinctorius]|uniref:BTB domain-containing protein n=1 Tax=Pisolithus tinctorius Marx 270 TaxID=870435 RepID=A0A0C3J0F1_PISTI|nr:hypothetical protein BKA82DRAFT_1002182 [Pisolithus tinctorius]KIO02573.1 hypothetical protein M404DRAFT_1002182 [Pisolithus tinctorius Marx 270]
MAQSQFQDDEFYMSLVTLRVEDRLFRVPRQILAAQSPVFKDMFSFPPPPDEEVEGSSDGRPIILPDVVKVDEFKQLLRALLPTNYHGSRLPKGDFDEWISVLKLSRMWQMDDIQRAALGVLKRYSTVEKSAAEKLALAMKYEIKDWIMPAIDELARRSEPISVEDAQILGLETALKVAAVRESTSERLRLAAGKKNDFTPHINRIFNLPASTQNQQ